jgi:WD40 repeat protein
VWGEGSTGKEILAEYGTSNTSLDLHVDGKVNMLDLALWAGGVPPTPTLTVTPVPTLVYCQQDSDDDYGDHYCVDFNVCTSTFCKWWENYCPFDPVAGGHPCKDPVNCLIGACGYPPGNEGVCVGNTPCTDDAQCIEGEQFCDLELEACVYNKQACCEQECTLGIDSECMFYIAPTPGPGSSVVEHGQICVDIGRPKGKCMIPCHEGNCPDNSFCADGGPLVCDSGICVTPTPTPELCDGDDDCGLGDICVNGQCVPGVIPNIVTNESCDQICEAIDDVDDYQCASIGTDIYGENDKMFTQTDTACTDWGTDLGTDGCSEPTEQQDPGAFGYCNQDGAVCTEANNTADPDYCREIEWTNCKCEAICDPANGSYINTSGSMDRARNWHTATLLADGRALLVGHRVTAEIYDPIADTFSVTGSMHSSRYTHTATLLNNGTVLITGGSDDKTAEIYDPNSGTFTLTSSPMNYTRYWHTATLLNNGTVLITGGFNYTNYEMSTTEIYDPVTDTFTPISNMKRKRYDHTATLLDNGEVLIAGGVGGAGVSAELYSPLTQSFSLTGTMHYGRAQHKATKLLDGNVLITGSWSTDKTAEIYNSSGGSFSLTPGNMIAKRWTHTSTLLPDGSVFITGGFNGSVELPSSEIFYPDTGTFTQTIDSMAHGRSVHAAVLLSNKKVLVTGNSVIAELYDTGCW